MIDVTCALIFKEEKILVAQRSHAQSNSMKWEFPGGKVETGESSEEAIVREIKEELDVEIEVEQQLEAVEHVYLHIHIRLIPFVVKHWKGNFTVKEHHTIDWINVDELAKIDLSEADKKVVQQLL
ncbi:(deoxy)nucleoside triphosphate pyrophosphohydrolase [Prolixibacteraceae bacterium JC049]|nr:(deoxy)nucleoside triphosphate pyrophosphohydrolase [Prolixibacteraceae bacterium JC049]